MRQCRCTLGWLLSAAAICHIDPLNLVKRSILSCVRSPPSPLLLSLDQRHSFPSNHEGTQDLVTGERRGSKSKHLTEKALVEVLIFRKAGARSAKYLVSLTGELCTGNTHRLRAQSRHSLS